VIVIRKVALFGCKNISQLLQNYVTNCHLCNPAAKYGELLSVTDNVRHSCNISHAIDNMKKDSGFCLLSNFVSLSFIVVTNGPVACRES
jgi:hypothetical protein